MLRFKICCVHSPAEVEMAVRAGASAIGLVSGMPSGPGILGEDRIAEIAVTVPPFVTSVLLTSRTSAEAMAEQVELCGVRAVQVCAPVERSVFAELRRLVPGRAILGVVHVLGPESIDRAREIEPVVDAVLLDTGVPSGPNRQLGGTGRTHD